MAQLTRKELVGHGLRQDTAAGKGLLKGCLLVRLSWLLGFPDCHGLSPGDAGQAARVYAKLCPGISGVGLQHRQGLARGSEPGEPRGRVRRHLWGEGPGQPSTAPTTALRTTNTSEPHIQDMCLGTQSPVGNIQHLLHQCQHVLLVQPLTHMWEQAHRCLPRALKQGSACG